MTNKQKQTVQRWIEALRSGEYEQGTGVLNCNNKYCCLGVLTDLQGVAGELKSYYGRENVRNYNFDEYNSSTSIPHITFNNWVGFDNTTFRDVMGEEIYITKDLMTANDEYELTFDEIADLLDIYLMDEGKNVFA